jgi:hypothetical protein
MTVQGMLIPMRTLTSIVALGLLAAPVIAQQSTDPFPASIPATDDVIVVNFAEFASLPDVDGEAARMMLLAEEPGTTRMFVNDMRGPLYRVTADGKAVSLYLDVNDAQWGVPVEARGAERGFQSFAFHPQFSQSGTPGFGKFYAYVDTSNMDPAPDFRAEGAQGNTHDTVPLEWTAKTPGAAAYDGGPPRELMRFEQPYANHNAGHLTFNPRAASGSPDFGLLYIGSADGGSGGDPLKLAQNRASAFGKILRIDPLGKNGTNGQYGIPASNPVAKGGAGALAEIYAVGLRNPQRFAWDPKSGAMNVADIGQNIVEEVSPVTAGANLGWNIWEGSFMYGGRGGVMTDKPRSDPSMTYPVVEYAQADPLLQNSSAVTMGLVYRQNEIQALANLLLFGDNPSGEIFYVSADRLPNGGQDAIRRVLFNDDGTRKTLLQLIQAKNTAQGKKPATRADLRFNDGPSGRIFVLNKRDGVIRVLRP